MILADTSVMYYVQAHADKQEFGHDLGLRMTSNNLTGIRFAGLDNQ